MDNCTILGWLFNSMEDRIYHMFIYNDTVHSLWIALSQLYAHVHHDSRIFELYQEIARTSQDTLGLYILNTSPLLSLYEALAIIDGDQRRRRLIQTSLAVTSESTPNADQMAFAACGLDPRSSGGKPICSYCGNIGHVREWCFKLHPELKGTSSKRKGKSQLGSLLKQQPSSSTSTLVTGTPTAYHAKTDHPTWFRSELAKQGILQQFTCPYTPEQNGIVECKNRSLMSIVRCLLRGMNMPKYFWHMAVLTAAFLLNCTPSRSLKGYFTMSKGYCCYDPISQCLYHSLDVTFLEDVPFFVDLMADAFFSLSMWMILLLLEMMHQRKDTLDLLQDTGMMGYRPASTPMDPNLKLSIESWELLSDASVYQCLVGCLIYLTNTRPDIIFAVSVMSQFLHAPRTSHLDAVHHILRYLKTCPGLGLFYIGRLRMGCHTSQMRIMQGQRVTYALLLDYIHFMATTFCHGKVRSRLLCLVLQLKQNIEPWLRAHGFPRADIDIPMVRADRHRLAGEFLYSLLSHEMHSA
ncbi:hypothetical protein Acr_00g0017420 [Actinidia rufa]|uniref:Integrase catalytic domain-containing protein n=1 Tax=Actinidia rufa TaxID=165716 RepID=A0A7J0DCK6_9ERIC|nr:hypothetical protein Acr_00g0017420 [Actinidia rufa]